MGTRGLPWNVRHAMNACGKNALTRGEPVKIGTWPELDRQCGAETRRGSGSPWAGTHNCTLPAGHNGEHACPCGLKGWRT